MSGMMDSGMMMGGALVWSLAVLLLLAVTVTALAMLALRGRGFSAGQPTDRSATTQQARHILRSRFAKGDIDDEEYRRRLASLDESM